MIETPHADDINKCEQTIQLQSPRESQKEPERIRWCVLALLCVLIYSMVYCLDIYSIQNQLIDDYGLSESQYALLYSLYSYLNMIGPFLGGLIIDYIGIYSSTVIFYVFIVFGQSLFVLSTFKTVSSYPLMLSGRSIFGVGENMTHLARKWLVYDYFVGTEYYFASAVSLSFSRLASASQAYASTILYTKYKSVVAVLSVGWILVVLSLIILIIFVCLQKIYDTHANKNDEHVDENKKFYLAELFRNGVIDRRWWLLGFATVSMYATYLSYSNVSSAFLQNRYKFSYEQSNSLAPVMFWIAVIFTPIYGILCDVYGKRTIFMVGAACCLLLGHIFLSFIGSSDTSICVPVFGLILLGMGYSLGAASTWPSFGLIIKRKYLATTLGIWGSIDNAILATSFITVGCLTKDYTIKQRKLYVDEFDTARYLWIVLALATLFWTILLWYYDAKMFGNTLWKPSDKFAKKDQKKCNTPHTD